MSDKPNLVDELIEKLGGPTKAARAFGIENPSVVINWRKRGQVPSDKVLLVEQVTGISRHDLRADIFGKQPATHGAGA